MTVIRGLEGVVATTSSVSSIIDDTISLNSASSCSLGSLRC
ncbi:hypothetical protein ACT453_37640, partial [Bacillus sp. D-CC]